MCFTPPEKDANYVSICASGMNSVCTVTTVELFGWWEDSHGKSKMLTESFIAATETVKPPATHLSSNLKDVGIFLHEYQPQCTLRQGFKKSSAAKNCLALSDTHVFTAQAAKAVVHVYSRERGNQEATVPFPQKISSLTYAEKAAILIIGTQDGKLMLWEVATGRVSTSSASHIEAVTTLVVSPDGDHVLSASADSSVHVWSISNLVSIERAQSGFGDVGNKRGPIATFSQHRSAVTALATGHSQHAHTNFVISCSEDKTCYIWNLETLVVLRTILLLQKPQCVVIDPADGAAYIGSSDGSIQALNVFEQQGASKSSILDNESRVAATAIQLESIGRWAPSTGSDPGAAQCIALSYDGTSLLTGHFSGRIFQWEVAKHRLTSEISSLTGQPVTNIQMQRPDGFQQQREAHKYRVAAVVKPRPDLAEASTASSTSAVPADYIFHAQVTQQGCSSVPMTDVEVAFQSSAIPESLLDAAVQSLVRSRVSGGRSNQVQGNGAGTSADLYKIDQMQEELVKLRSQVATHQKLDQERIERHMARMSRREAVGIRKREAFFTAKKTGKNGDEAMKPFMQQEKDIDRESDEETVAEHAARSNGDVDMAG